MADFNFVRGGHQLGMALGDVLQPPPPVEAAPTEEEQLRRVQAAQQNRQAAAGTGGTVGQGQPVQGGLPAPLTADPRSGLYSPQMIQQQTGLQSDPVYGNVVNRMAAQLMPMRQAYDEYIHPEQNAAYAQMNAQARQTALGQYLQGIHGLQGHEQGMLGQQTQANQVQGNLAMQMLQAQSQMSGAYQARDVGNARLKAGDTEENARQAAMASQNIAENTPLDFHVGPGGVPLLAPGGQGPGGAPPGKQRNQRIYDPIVSELQGSMPAGPAGANGVRMPPTGADGKPLGPVQLTSQMISNLRSRYGDDWVTQHLPAVNAYIQEKIPDADEFLHGMDYYHWAGGQPTQEERNRQFWYGAMEQHGHKFQHTPAPVFNIPMPMFRPEMNAILGKWNDVKPVLFGK